MLKAMTGGGGRGIRRIECGGAAAAAAGVQEAWDRCLSEASRSFGGGGGPAGGLLLEGAGRVRMGNVKKERHFREGAEGKQPDSGNTVG